MLDYARAPAPDATYHEPPPLDHFDTLRKKWTVSYSYGNYYSAPAPAPYDNYVEPDLSAAASVYHDLVGPRDPPPPPPPAREPWHYRYVSEWSEDDTASWLLETLRYNGIDEYDFPFFHFRVPGVALRGLKREQIVQLLSNPSRDPAVSRRTGDIIYEKLQQAVSEEMRRYAEYEYAPHETAATMLDLDAQEPRAPPRHYAAAGGLEAEAGGGGAAPPGGADSGSEAEDGSAECSYGSAECSYGSDGSKSGDEELARRVLKRPPGRPRGSGRTLSKRPRSVSVPEFLRNLLLDPNYCPTIIKWEDHSQGKFR